MPKTLGRPQGINIGEKQDLKKTNKTKTKDKTSKIKLKFPSVSIPAGLGVKYSWQAHFIGKCYYGS